MVQLCSDPIFKDVTIPEATSIKSTALFPSRIETRNLCAILFMFFCLVYAALSVLIVRLQSSHWSQFTASSSSRNSSFLIRKIGFRKTASDIDMPGFTEDISLLSGNSNFFNTASQRSENSAIVNHYAIELV